MKEIRVREVTVDINHYTLDKFCSTGHPRTVGIVLGKSPNPNRLFTSVEIIRLSVDGERITG